MQKVTHLKTNGDCHSNTYSDHSPAAALYLFKVNNENNVKLFQHNGF